METLNLIIELLNLAGLAYLIFKPITPLYSTDSLIVEATNAAATEVIQELTVEPPVPATKRPVILVPPHSGSLHPSLCQVCGRMCVRYTDDGMCANCAAGNL